MLLGYGDEFDFEAARQASSVLAIVLVTSTSSTWIGIVRNQLAGIIVCQLRAEVKREPTSGNSRAVSATASLSAATRYDDVAVRTAEHGRRPDESDGKNKADLRSRPLLPPPRPRDWFA